MLNMETFGRRIASLRQRAGLTQNDVAEVCLVTVQAVSKWDRGLSCPDALMLERIAKALGVEIQELFCEKSHEAV